MGKSTPNWRTFSRFWEFWHTKAEEGVLLFDANDEEE
jgi:hypothetical protein